jgi:hypothetical protein
MDRKRPDLSGQSLRAASLAVNRLCSELAAFRGEPDPPRLETIFSNRRIVRGENRVHFSLPRPYTGSHDALEKPSPYPNSGQDKRDGV